MSKSISKDMGLSDEQLMLNYAQQGDQQAFAKLYERYKKSVYRYCIRMVNDEGLGADIYQETWSKIIKAREKYQVKATFKTYIFHVAHNLIIDAWRKRSSQGEKIKLVSIDDDRNESVALNLEANDNIFAKLHTEEQLTQFHWAITQLPTEQRDAVLLHYSQGLTLQQIADLESVGRETIKSRLRYAVKKMKHLILVMNEHSTPTEAPS